jgi:hypothetical protein
MLFSLFLLAEKFVPGGRKVGLSNDISSIGAGGQPFFHMPNTRAPSLAGYEEPSSTHPWHCSPSSS